MCVIIIRIIIGIISIISIIGIVRGIIMARAPEVVAEVHAGAGSHRRLI